ncbi:MAG: LamG-like jellyroll fold domain-containing protein [Planctomycetota bacterium]
MRVRISLVTFFCWLSLGGGLKQTEAAEPVGWWKLDETTGSIAYDSSGNGFNAAVNLGSGSAIWQPAGGFDSNGCASFTAQQYVLIPNGVWDLIGDQMSIAFWVNQDPAHPPGSNWPGPWGCARTPGLNWPDYNWLQLRAHLPRPDAAIDIGKDEESVYWAPGDPNTYAGRWNHYVFIKDVNAHTLTLYHNGLKVDQRTGQMEPMPDVNHFMLGGVIYPYPDWYGKIDDFRIYNCALSQFDILKLLRTNPAGAWNGFPADGAEDVPVNITLKWSPGDYAAEANGHDVYFGTDFADVNSAVPADLDADGLIGIGDLNVLADWWLLTPPADLSPLPNIGGESIVNLKDLAFLAGQWGKQSIYKGRYSTTDFSPAILDANTAYYWRVDEVNQANVWKGDVWQFKTKGLSRVFNDGPGNIRYLIGNDDFVEMQTLFWVPMKGWSPNASSESWNAANVTFSGTGPLRQWTGTMTADGNEFDYRIVQQTEDNDVNLHLEVTSHTNAAMENVSYALKIPVSVFSQGKVELRNGSTLVGSTTLPAVLPPNYQLLFANANRVIIENSSANIHIEMMLSRVVPMGVQDNRQFGDSIYWINMRFHDGNLPSGQTAAINARTFATIVPDNNTAHVTVDPCTMTYHFDGWGGAFSFQIGSAQAQYNMDTLNPSWARVQMSIPKWEPANDNNNPNDTNWAYFEGRVTPGSNLEQEFLMAKQLQDRNIPYSISIWYLPTWMQPLPSTAVAPEMWPEVVESICSYIEFARDHYGVEPNYFSFNEPSIGVYTLFSPEQHRDAIKLLGEAFAACGLKTKMVLAEACGPTVETSYAQPTINDPCALQYVGVVSIHSWMSGDYAPWAAGVSAWSDLADSIGVPLVVGEVGSDSGAYHTPWIFPMFDYAIGDLRNYIGLLHYGRPRGVMQWEYTNDYTLVDMTTLNPVPNYRYYYIKQIQDYSADSNAVAVTCDNSNVMAVAFKNNAGLTIHLTNFGPPRQAVITGLPAGITNAGVIRTTETEQFRQMDDVPVISGSAVIDLERFSLTTVTFSDDE